ncbi:MAG: hypothetical protein NTW17_02665 [Candidatus Pacearchaeota archaeon]|nr:hypothetical protein [Candidatus Pacearchaeota archaeon]
MLKTVKQVREQFLPSEQRVILRLNSPAKVQDFLDSLEYTLGVDGEPYFSPRRVLAERTADCLEGAIFAAAALRFHGRRPMIFYISSVNDHDHVIALFKNKNHWGAISQSKYTGMGYREPIHRSLRELTLSYFESYFNFESEKTARGYSRPVDLSRFDDLNWMTTAGPVKFIEDYLNSISFTAMLTPGMIKGLRGVTPLMLEAGELLVRKKGVRNQAADHLKKALERG